MFHSASRIVLCILLAGCAQSKPVPADPPRSDPAPALTEVFVLGMIHDAHRSSEWWGLDEVRETIRAIDPDVVCPEIPPARWPGTIQTWNQKHVVEDSRVSRFPEYVDVLLPLTDEMDFVVESSAGWTTEMADARRARIELFETSTADANAFAAYTADEKWVQDWLAAYPAPAVADDPFYIHSPEYDLRTKAELGPYEFHLNEVIGPPGGWTYINEEHFALIEDAIARHRGQRILITFGAGHKYWFLERLRQMPGVALMDVRPYLPDAAAHPLTDQQAAGEELLQGFESLRVWWSASRAGHQIAWKRIEAMLAVADRERFLDTLRDSEGSQASEFRDGPFLGPVEAAQDESGNEFLRASVRRLHDEAKDARWLSATLVPDPDRPGGFAWTALELPRWLLAQEKQKK